MSAAVARTPPVEHPHGKSRRRPQALLTCLLLGFCAFSACGSNIDITQVLEVTDTSGGWFDAGVVDGNNKLVPSVSFRIQKKIGDPVRPLSLNILFRTVDGEDSSLNQDVYVQRVDFEGNTTGPIVVRPEAGYTAAPPQSRAEMLQNSLFRDMRVTIFAKHSSTQWVELARYDLPRQLLTE